MLPRLIDTLYWLTWAALIGLPIAVLGTAFARGVSVEALSSVLPSIQIAPDLGFGIRLSAFAIGLVPGCIVLWTLWQVQALFVLYRHDMALTRAAAQRLRAIGLGLAGTAALAVVFRPLQILLLTSGNAPGERVLALSITSSDIGFALAGGLMVVIGHVMADAARIAEDNASIV